MGAGQRVRGAVSQGLQWAWSLPAGWAVQVRNSVVCMFYHRRIFMKVAIWTKDVQTHQYG